MVWHVSVIWLLCAGSSVTPACDSDPAVEHLYQSLLLLDVGHPLTRWQTSLIYDASLAVCPIAQATVRLAKLAANPIFASSEALGAEADVLSEPWVRTLQSHWGERFFRAIATLLVEVCNPAGMGSSGSSFGPTADCKNQEPAPFAEYELNELLAPFLFRDEKAATLSMIEEAMRIPHEELMAHPVKECSFKNATVLVWSAVADVMSVQAPAELQAEWLRSHGAAGLWGKKVAKAQEYWMPCAARGFISSLATQLPLWGMLLALSNARSLRTPVEPQDPHPPQSVRYTIWEPCDPLQGGYLRRKVPDIRGIVLGANVYQEIIVETNASTWMLSAMLGFEDLDSLVVNLGHVGQMFNFSLASGGALLRSMAEYVRQSGAPITVETPMSFGEFVLSQTFTRAQFWFKMRCHFGERISSRASVLGMESKLPFPTFTCEVPASMVEKQFMEVNLEFDGFPHMIPLRLCRRPGRKQPALRQMVNPPLPGLFAPRPRGFAMCPRPVFGLNGVPGIAFRDWLHYHLNVLEGVALIMIMDIDGTAGQHLRDFGDRIEYIPNITEKMSDNMHQLSIHLHLISTAAGHHPYVPAVGAYNHCFARARSRGAALVAPFPIDKFLNSAAKRQTILRLVETYREVSATLEPTVYEHKMPNWGIPGVFPTVARFPRRQACAWEDADSSWLEEVLAMPSHDLFFRNRCRGRILMARPEEMLGELHHSVVRHPRTPSTPNVHAAEFWVHHYSQMYTPPMAVRKWHSKNPDLWRRQFAILETRMLWAVPHILAGRNATN